MFLPLCLTVLLATAWATPMTPLYSFSPAVGSGSGTSYLAQGDGSITAIRAWENYNSYVTGFQIRYGYIWGSVIGRTIGPVKVIELFEGESIIQLSGKYHTSNYIYLVTFVTSEGRSFSVGQPLGYSFNFYPKYAETELRFISGRRNSAGITSIAAHWGTMNSGNITAT